MASVYTSLENVIVPEIFAPYVIERTTAKSKILQSGIAAANPKLDELLTWWYYNENAFLARFTRTFSIMDRSFRY